MLQVGLAEGDVGDAEEGGLCRDAAQRVGVGEVDIAAGCGGDGGDRAGGGGGGAAGSEVVG